MPTLEFDAAIPVELQLTPYSCSVGAAFWCLQSLGVQITQQQLQVLMVPRLVSSDLGLLDGSGSTIAQLLRDQFGLAASSQSGVAFDDVAQRAGLQPVALGGHRWYVDGSGQATGHWVAVRRVDGDQLILANPGGTGPNFGQQSLGRLDFVQRGPFSAVWIDAGAGTAVATTAGRAFRVANTEGQGANLRSDPSATASLVTAVAEGAQVTGDEYAWRQVTDATGAQGWVANDFVSPSNGKFAVANTGGQGVNLRGQPSPAGERVKNLAGGTELTGDEHAWRQVADGAGNRGWMADDLLVPA